MNVACDYEAPMQMLTTEKYIAPREGPGLNAWVSRYHYPQSSNKQLLLWKISSANN